MPPVIVLLATNEVSMIKWTKWRIVDVKNKFYIKRNGLGENTGKTQNYPIAKYKFIQNDYDELDSLVLRLNNAKREQQQKRLLIENAYIPQKYVDDFAEYVSGEHGSEKTTREMISPFIRYGLKYLQQTYDENPSNWTEHEKKWGNYLLKKNFSKSYIRSIIQTMNRFLKYTHERNKRLFPFIKLNPLSTNKLNLHEEKRIDQINIDGHRDPFGYFISDKDKKIIFKNLSDDIVSAVKLMDLYGLRESEVLGLATNKKCLTKKYLSVTVQIDSVGKDCQHVKTKLPKWRKTRKIPHWHNVELSSIAKLIGQIKLMHPDTIAKKFAKDFDNIDVGKKYRLHDFRRTYITRMFDLNKIPTDIMDAVGHKKIDTTLSYRREKDDDDNEEIEW